MNRAGLEKRNKRIVKLREKRWTLQEIGAEVGLTRERVRQILRGYNLNARLPYKPVYKKCEWCGSKYEKRPRGISAYCSNECGTASFAEQAKNPKGKWSKFGYTVLTCVGCKKKFKRQNRLHSIIKATLKTRGFTSNRTFCTRACYHKHQHHAVK